LTLTPLPATCWAYSATASKQPRQCYKTKLYAARWSERAPPPVFGAIDCGDASEAKAASSRHLTTVSGCFASSSFLLQGLLKISQGAAGRADIRASEMSKKCMWRSKKCSSSFWLAGCLIVG
jgi:hypothetical protein